MAGSRAAGRGLFWTQTGADNRSEHLYSSGVHTLRERVMSTTGRDDGRCNGEQDGQPAGSDRCLRRLHEPAAHREIGRFRCPKLNERFI